MIKLTDIIYYGNGFVATFDDNSVANARFKVVNGKLIAMGLNPEQKTAIDTFNNTFTSLNDLRFQGKTITSSSLPLPTKSHTNSAPVTADDNGRVLDNKGATSAITLTADDNLTDGFEITIAQVAGQEITFKPDDSNFIYKETNPSTYSGRGIVIPATIFKGATFKLIDGAGWVALNGTRNLSSEPWQIKAKDCINIMESPEGGPSAQNTLWKLECIAGNQVIGTVTRDPNTQAIIYVDGATAANSEVIYARFTSLDSSNILQVTPGFGIILDSGQFSPSSGSARAIPTDEIEEWWLDVDNMMYLKESSTAGPFTFAQAVINGAME